MEDDNKCSANKELGCNGHDIKYCHNIQMGRMRKMAHNFSLGD
jgi:hypothetical protein